MPAYNSCKYIHETLNSIKAQDYQNWELIVVEDGTNDGTERIINDFKNQVKQNVVYFNQKDNLGVSATRNKAVSLSTGVWVAFLDSDDLWDSSHLSDLISTSFQYPDSKLVHSEVSVFDSINNAELPSTPLSQETIDQWPLSLYDGRYPTQPSSAMILLEFYKQMGGFKAELEGCEDKELWFRSARAGCKFAYTGRTTSYYRKHANALTAQGIKMSVAMACVYSLHFDWKEIPINIKAHYTSQAWLSAARIIRSTNKKLAKEYLKKSMEYNRNFNHLLFWVLLRLSN